MLTLIAHHSVMGWWAFGLGETVAGIGLATGFVMYLRLALANAAEQDEAAFTPSENEEDR